MNEHVKNVMSLLGSLAYMVKDTDPNGLDLYFADPSAHKPIHHRNTRKLVTAVLGKNFVDNAGITGRLTTILEKYEKKLMGERPWWKFWSSSPQLPRPMTVYIFTDGVWCQRSRTDMDNLMMIVEDTLSKSDAKPFQLGIQFIQFGRGVAESHELQRLCKSTERYVQCSRITTYLFSADNYRKIIDVEPFEGGNVWKMLLGTSDHWARWRRSSAS